MKRRPSALQRGVRRVPSPFVSSGSRMAHSMQIRAGDPVAGILDVTREGMSARLAGDVFRVAAPTEMRHTSSIVGVGYASEIRISGDGPIFNVSANDAVIENVRFVYDGSLPSTSLVTRPVRCSGESYAPTDLSVALSACAVKITGNNVTIRNCWFDGFDNAILSTGTNTVVESCHFKGGHNSTKSSVYLAGTNGNVTGCYMESTAYGVYATGNTSLISGNTALASETAIFVTSDYNRIHDNYCEGDPDGFAVVLTVDAKYNSVTGNVVLPDKSKGTYYFISPATSKNQYGANIGEVDIE